MKEDSAVALFCLIGDALKAYHHKSLIDPGQESMLDSAGLT